jgi:class 3 adenylate cyclase/DNA-binding winged helix-turn-helix (wHTH) protein/predicted ATPase
MIYIFADCELHTQQRLLTHAGQEVHLRSQAYKVLLYLLENRDQIFSQADLIDALWPDPFVKPWTVETTIREIRRAVGDSIKTQRVIETRPRQGYRFIAHLKGPFEIIEPADPDVWEAASEPDSWQCHVCGHTNRAVAPQRSRFCTQCGTPFRSTCPRCAGGHDPHDKFCGACGYALSSLPDAAGASDPSPSPPISEHRQLTVLSCELVESVALAEQMDLEDYRDIIRVYRDMCDEIIRHYDGHITHDLGTGLLIYFGYPRCHEDDAHRAVRTGLAITEGLGAINARLRSEKNVTLEVRWGVHTGPVVVEEATHASSASTVVLGEVPNIAQQIQRLAVPGTGVIGASTARLVETHFVCEALSPRRLESSAQCLPLFRVLEPAILNLKGQTPFVGREAELAMLRDRWMQAKDGFGQVVLLNGDPGIGKSRLVHVMQDHLSEVAYILECHCSPYHQHSVFYPIIQLLKHYFLHWEAGDTPEAKLDKLELFLAECALSLADTLPLLASLLSLSDAEERYAPLHLTADQQRQQILETLLSTLLTLAAEHPMLLVIEDLHWIDPSTQELLDRLVERVPTQHLLAVFTYRPEFQVPWGSRSYITPIPLSRLSPSYAEQMVSHVTGKKSLPKQVLCQIIDKTDGVPLFVEECTKSLIEAGTMHETDGRYELLAPLQAMTVPATLHDSLMARLDRLEIAKGVAQLGAVLGRQFDYALLKAVWKQDEHLLQRGLNRLVGAELLYRQGQIPRASYTFKHALIQDVAYQSLLKSTRQQYHRWAAQALTEHFPDSAALQPEVPARHYTEAGLVEQAIPYWKMAGALAVERSAHAEAVNHFTKGLELLEQLPKTVLRTQDEFVLQLALGQSLRMIKGHLAEDVERIYTRVYELSQEAGEPEQRFAASVGLWRLYLNRAQLRAASELAKQSLAFAEQEQNPVFLHEAYHMLGMCAFFQGDFREARINLEQSLHIFFSHQARIRAFKTGMDPGVVCLSCLAWVLWMLGFPDQAMAKSQEAIDLAQQLSHTYSLGFALQYAALLFQCCRDPNRVQELAETIIGLAQQQGFIQWYAGGVCMRGWALAEQGQVEEGLKELSKGVASWQSGGSNIGMTHWFFRLAEIHGKQGHAEKGLQALEQAFEVLDRNEERHFTAEVYRLKGELLLALDDHGHYEREAETCFWQAIQIARQQEARAFELRATMRLSCLWRRQGRRVEAYNSLAEIYRWFTEGDRTLDLQDAKRQLQNTK